MEHFMSATRSRLLAWPILAAVLIGAVFPKPANAQTQKIRIAYSSRSNTVTPLYVAADRGFFVKKGWRSNSFRSVRALERWP